MKLEPQLRLQMAQFLALADPRCGLEQAHERIVHAEPCPSCHRDIFGYMAMVPLVWSE